MLPLGNPDVPRWTTPVVTYALLAINVVVFIYMLGLNDLNQQIFILKNGVIPAEFTSDFELGRERTSFGVIDLTSPFGTWSTMLTSMFIHGGFMHIIGNMLFLLVFGDNIEDKLGHIKFLLFYLVAGLAAAWAQIGIDPGSQVPMVGASGAIAGVLGAYLLAYPYSRINTLVIFYFITFVRVPAVLLLGFWFLLQLFNGVGSLAPNVASTGGVAYFAHLGGFVAGLLIMVLYKLLRGESPIPPRPGSAFRYYRF